MAKPHAPPVFLVAVDGSPPSERALDFAVTLAAKQGARLRVVTVEDIGLLRAEAVASTGLQTLVPTFEEVARETLAKAKAAVEAAGGSGDFAVLPVAEPAAAIVRDAEQKGAFLVVVGSHGRTGISRALLGSVAERVVRHAHGPVLVVR